MARHFMLGRLGDLAVGHPRLENAVWRVESWLVSGLWRLSGRLSPASASRLGAMLGRRVGPRLGKHHHVLANLRRAFPEQGDAEREQTARDIWANMGRVLLEFPHLRRMGREEVERWIEIVDRGGLAEARQSRRPAIFVTPHLGNWNLAVVAATRAGRPLSAVYSRQTNHYLEAEMDRYRRGLPCEFIDAADAGRAMLEELRAGRSIGLLPDQRYDGGELLPFFGEPALTPVGPARIAIRLGVPFVPIRVERSGDARFRITVHPALHPDPALHDSREQARLMMTELNRLFESWIRERPGEWLCAKRRWPRVPPDGASPPPADHDDAGRKLAATAAAAPPSRSAQRADAA